MTIKQIIFRIAIILLIVEAIIMLVLDFLALNLDWITEAIVDALSLTIFATPIIYKLVIKPFVLMRETAENRVTYLAYHDELTSLANRTKLLEWLDHSIKTSYGKNNISIILLELDRFKDIQDTFGHAIVDNLVLDVAERLRCNVSGVHLFAKIDTYMFAFVVENILSDDDIYLKSKQIITLVQTPISCKNGHAFNIEASIGISRFPKDASNKTDLLKYAYTAMRQAKTISKDKISFYTQSLTEMSQRHLTLEEDLRHAIENNEFHLLYQPKIDALTNKLVGVEALIRWEHPKNGLINPVDFIPLAEETGLIIPIGEWVLQEALKQQEIWQKDGKEPIVMSINLSGRQLQIEHIDQILRVLNLTPVPKKYIDFEITETYLMEDALLSQMLLEKLHSTGVSLSMDDFGTGYSSLAYLKRFKVNTLKIDRALIQDIEEDKNDFAIAKAIIAMGHTLEMKVVAEGVETEEQSRMLKQISCDYIQGFYFSRPVHPYAVYSSDNYTY
ncbi:putative bifunctional diguanylate cyclase/phosphodiesterase [Candidatus Sulfurimonas baltica]|uniref:GGDEF domain-containing protein n=1 Tax=Candidatus Sulfurimonas baltica TaxID=2740404 RepID=A0A7S7RN32_9BACT|nr:bifunctional diguanylate cyclase/phosphodiesterase [Candidatus Sulfurimonas baltica]QOY52091.1 GGDEF domain-containing protein [Candidatus Sulfurimonas baltica]